MLDERPRQYERLAAEGRLAEMEAEGEWDAWKYVFSAFGAIAVAFGLLLVVAIFVGLGKLWFGR